jgi:hypothetical protein
MGGLQQMRELAEKRMAVAKDFASQAKISAFERTQAAENPRRAAGGARREIILLNQQSALPGASTLQGNRDAGEASANDGDLEVLSG